MSTDALDHRLLRALLDTAADLAPLERCGKNDAGGAVLRESCEHVVETLVAEGRADAVGFGRDFIATPDLVARIRDRRFAADAARISPASEMSRVSISTPACPANAWTIGRNDAVASAGASSVCV